MCSVTLYKWSYKNTPQCMDVPVFLETKVILGKCTTEEHCLEQLYCILSAHSGS